MFAKILLTALVVGAVLVLTLKPWRNASGSGRIAARNKSADDLVRCPSCGVYRLPDRPCDCGQN